MTKHTPGPWATYRDQLSVGETQGHSSICEVWERNGGEGFENARLIAAAPELLEALQWSTFWLEGCLKCEAYTWDADQREAAEEALKNSLAAIAKARGEA
ncbi:hypothetical protein [Stutzerimonas frequens]|uniref:hypothetical protein n=1 Tax=Pseudomonas phage PS-1 TaxID=1573458 RepID=UPI00065C1DAF|nr:hypothetical protein [Stutzerimonas frequens]YP_009222785.1 hypothetical protein AXI79_gp15 [Pseudomonas phage PS-1]MBK3872160.1 hypothetical protein [Stutzerimonas frequens]MBK3910691.1 hypothetical protein [Stutzerimonas frequens]MBK3929970.1 hypothetical protein [Stutzerimonas frequens]BAR92353.1 hypothetical protein [Pseudomonas phage PS-1]